MKLPAKQTVYLYFTACIANLLSFSVGIAFSWVSPAIPILDGTNTDVESPLPEKITESETSLIGALFILGSTIGPFIAAIFAQKLGRRWTIIIFALPIVACFLMKALAHKLWLILLARFVGGLSGGVIYTIIPIFVADISEKHNRGVLSCLLGLLSVTGNLSAYILGSYMPLQTFAYVGLAPPIILIVIMVCFISETPYFWIERNDEVKALEVLQKIRTQNVGELKEEIVEIRRTIQANSKEKGSFKDILQSRALKKSLTITVCSTVFQQCSGNFAILSYLQKIFHDSGSTIPSDISAITIGVVKVFAYFITITAVDRLGRRLLLLLSSAGIVVSLLSLATYFFAKSANHDMSNFTWLPLTALIIFVIFFNIGFGNVPVVQLGEFFPQRVKAIAAIVVITVSSILSFGVVYIFPPMTANFGYGATFCIYAFSAFLGGLYSYFFVPETKGKSLYEIQIMLGERDTNDKIKNTLL